jgi:hypothetical protein
MALDSYNALKLSIAGHLDRDDLNGFIDDFIDVAESAHRRDVRIRQMLVREPITIGSRFVPLPSGILETLALRCLTNPPTVLRELSMFEMLNSRRTSAGIPQYFALYGDEIEFDVEISQPIEGEIIYYKTLEPLSDTNPSNALLQISPDVYLYAALAASAPYLMNDERIQIWGGLYGAAVAGLDRVNLASRRVGPLVSRVHGAVV